MKKKLAIALVLALVLLITLATPVLSGPPDKAPIRLSDIEDLDTQVVGKCLLRIDNNDALNVIVVLSGADSGSYDVYWVSANYNNPDNFSYGELLGVITVDEKGSGRLISTDDHVFTAGEWGIRIFIRVGGTMDLKYLNNNLLDNSVFHLFHYLGYFYTQNH